uniref:Uncharacterized protein n=1 Tax=Melanopsichium pennsylvanicum 4 TaxID=1398559 RepID=A0A077RDK8_9BASI|nr:hypothetical protein BN887_04777 [Melanopsichium pennsylvanicum 4]
MQQELELARVIAPDTLAVFSALMAQQISGPNRLSDASRRDDHERSPAPTQVQLHLPPTSAHPIQQEESQMASTSRIKSQKLDEKPELWKVVDLLEQCFPAVAPAISVAAENPDPNANSGRWRNLRDFAAVPIKELLTLLSGTTASQTQSLSGAQTIEPQLSIKELPKKILAASEITRIATTLLWALLAFVKHRTEELLRIDAVLMCFMQAWQAGSWPDSATVVGSVPVSNRVDMHHG